jgi:hypothetical protein
MTRASSTKRSKKTARPTWLTDPNVIVFAGERELRVGVVEEHGFADAFTDLFPLPKEEVRADWARIVGQIRFLLDGVSAATKDFALDEITFQLGFSAEGKIVFVAKAGITTTIGAKFTHKK